MTSQTAEIVTGIRCQEDWNAVAGAAAVGGVLGTAGGILGGAGIASAEENVVNPNKLIHIFGKPSHNLAALVTQFGSETAAYNAIEAATSAAAAQQGITGVFQVIVNVGGHLVTVRGTVIDGVVRIGTAFIP